MSVCVAASVRQHAEDGNTRHRHKDTQGKQGYAAVLRELAAMHLTLVEVLDTRGWDVAASLSGKPS